MDMVSIETAPPVIINLFDEDLGVLSGKSRDFLGRAIINLDCNCVSNFTESNVRVDFSKLNQPPTPQWHSLRAGSD